MPVANIFRRYRAWQKFLSDRGTLGVSGELLTMGWFFLHGYLPMRWGWRGIKGIEVDLILRRGRELLVLEVKTRHQQKSFKTALGQHQLNRQEQAVAHLTQKYPTHTINWDAIFISPQWPWLQRTSKIKS